MTSTGGPKQSRIPAAAATDPDLTALDRQLLMVLGRHTDKDGLCSRSQARMAVEIGVARRSISRSLRRLEASGYVSTTPRDRENGGQTAHDFQLHAAPDQGRLPIDLPLTKRARRTDADVPAEASVTTTPLTRRVQGAPDRERHPPLDPRSHPQEERSLLNGPSRNGGCAAAREVANDRTFPDAVPGNEADAAPPPDRERLAALERRLREVAGGAINAAHPAFLVLAEPLAWIAAGCDLELDIVPVISGLAARTRASPVRSWGYFASAVREARDRRLAMARPADVVPLRAASADRAAGSASPARPSGRFAEHAARHRREFAEDAPREGGFRHDIDLDAYAAPGVGQGSRRSRADRIEAAERGKP